MPTLKSLHLFSVITVFVLNMDYISDHFNSGEEAFGITVCYMIFFVILGGEVKDVGLYMILN